MAHKTKIFSSFHSLHCPSLPQPHTPHSVYISNSKGKPLLAGARKYPNPVKEGRVLGISKNSIRHICNHLLRHGLWTRKSFCNKTSFGYIQSPNPIYRSTLGSERSFPHFLPSWSSSLWMGVGFKRFSLSEGFLNFSFAQKSIRGCFIGGRTRSPTRNLIYSVKLNEIWQGTQREYLRVANQQQINAFPTFCPFSVMV